MKKLSKKMLSFLLASALIIQSIGLIPAHAEEGDPSDTPPGVENFVDPEGSPPLEDGDEIETPPLEGDDETPISPEEGEEGTILPEDGEETTTPEEEEEDSFFEKVIGALGGIMPLGAGMPENLGNDIFKFESLKIGEGSEAVTITGNQLSKPLEITESTTVSLKYKYDIQAGVTAGSWTEFTIPEAFNLGGEWPEQDLLLSDNKIGTYTLTGRTVKVIFDETQEGIDDGYLDFSIKFDIKKFSENVVMDIPFFSDASKNPTITMKPKNTTTAISKLGIPDQEKNTNYITWTVDYINTGDTAVSDVTFEDQLPIGLSYEAGSMQYQEFAVKSEGTKGALLGSAITVIPTKTDGVNGEKLSIDTTLPSLQPYRGYQITYKTNINTDGLELTEFKNAAKIFADSDILSTDSTVTLEQRSEPIEKTGELVPRQAGDIKDFIEWTIIINEGGGTLNDARLDDTATSMTPGLETPTSMEIIPLTKNGQGQWTEGDPTTKNSSPLFPHSFGDITPNQAYKVVFRTEIDYSHVNSGNYTNTNNFTNDAKLIVKVSGTDKEYTGSDTVTVPRESVFSKQGNNTGYNPTTNPYLNWTIRLNQANQPLTGAKVHDLIPAGLTITKSDITIKNGLGNVDLTFIQDKITIIQVEPGNWNTLGLTSEDVGKTYVTFDFGDLNEYRAIEYKTKVVDFTPNKKFENKACLTTERLRG